MSRTSLSLSVHGERLAIVRLDPDAATPEWARGGFVTTSRTRAELSIVCAQAGVPPGPRQERDRIAIGIDGVVPMTTVGLLAGLCADLAAAAVPVFVISTFDTDWILVTADRFAAARAALVAGGHTVRGEPPVR